MKIRNVDIAQILFEIGEYLAMQNIQFKPRAYQKAAGVIKDLSEEVADIYEREGLKGLKQIPGVGQAIAEKVEELLKTGKLAYYERLKKEMPVNLSALSTIEGLGPKKIKAFYEALGVRSVSDLEKAARRGKIKNLEGFGEKSEENILKGIAFYHSQGQRMTLDRAIPLGQKLEDFLKDIPGVSRAVVAGSLRRRKETVGDLDLLAVSKNPGRVMDAFVSQPNVARVLAKGKTKASVVLEEGIDADLRVVEARSYGAALNYFTGSKAHNVALRRIAQKRGLKLNEYGLFKGEKQIAGKSEDELYKALGFKYIEPELRENTGEIEASGEDKLPKLVGYGDLKGDLQIQTNWTDGKNSIEEMVEGARARGLEYIAITDHTKNLAMTGGLDVKRVREQIVYIDKLNRKLGGKFRILKGTECDILRDGNLDLPDDVLKELDVVGVSIHTYFNFPKAKQTERLKRAIGNPHVDILFHPTARRIGRRPAIEVDMDEIIGFAKETGTVLEIDGHPERLDLMDEYIKRSTEEGVKLSISSDAHSVSGLQYLQTGIAQARRGWAGKGDIINSWPVEKCLSFLKDGRR
ncbi:MAG: DNA polymerase/3'-5' exonuclease PolX [bacterium]|nr:DNA polymerase/3'-5' exonuclease PolX [bacterium]